MNKSNKVESSLLLQLNTKGIYKLIKINNMTAVVTLEKNGKGNHILSIQPELTNGGNIVVLELTDIEAKEIEIMIERDKKENN